MFVIAGLGNPGRKYEGTRHNCGFAAIDVLADRIGTEIRTEKCRGLIGSKALGEIDTTSIDAFIKDQSRGRVSYIVDRGESARADAEREARKAGPDAKAKLIAERDGACSNYKS